MKGNCFFLVLKLEISKYKYKSLSCLFASSYQYNTQ